jgi:2,4-dienoyl-CoA reductase (NADPH2)
MVKMLELRNQFIMPPIKLGYSSGNGFVNQRHLDFYNLRSKHIGAVTLEPLYLDPGLRELPTQIGIDKDDTIEGLKKLVSLIHSNGAKVIAHLNHPGRMANPGLPGNYFISSTNKACENGGTTPTKMNRELMNHVIRIYSDAAKRAVKCGFDIIEIQFGHGYLLAQFISPAVNDRMDEYGGNFSNRVKFPLEVLQAVRNSVDVPIIARISGDEMIPSGFHIEEMIEFSLLLGQNGIDAIHVSAGSVCSTPPWFFQHMFIPKGKTWEFAGKIKNKVNIPVIFVGRINSIEDINYIKEKYAADFLAVGRAMVADPDFIGKYLNKVEGLIRPCLACAEGCLGGVKNGIGLSCVVNPLVNSDYPEISKSDHIKKIAVIGGGLAGMEAAITLQARGHQVELFEKNKLGGQFNLASLPPNKESLKEIIDYYISEIDLHKIKLIHKEAMKADVENGNYDAVIMATGAIPDIPSIKGLKEFYWTEFLKDDELPHRQRVLVIGGGLIGLEIASKLVDGDNFVTIVEMMNEIGRGMETIEKAVTLKKLKSKNVEIFINHKVVEINGKKVLLEGEDENIAIDYIDKIVIATGMKSYIPFERTGKTPFYLIGDAKEIGKARDAIHSAYKLAATI